MQNPQPIKFMYSTAAYDSYIKEGFTSPDERVDLILKRETF